VSAPGSRLFLLGNLAVAALWALYTWSRFELWRESLAPLVLVLLLRNSVVTLLFLFRRPPLWASRDGAAWAVAIAGTALGFFYGTGAPLLPRAGAALMLVGALASVVASLALGRSFGIVPANRGLKTEGPYALVRHPLYAAYLAFDLGFLLQAASPRNAAVFAGMALTSYLRGRFEERVLGLDPGYRSYAARTRHMFIPGVL
jgi:protein-S-isoprenylcysteine O-methyltransferase Ste14